MMETNLNYDIAEDFFHGRTVIGLTEIKVVTPIVPDALKGIQVKAGPGNTGTVYVGKSGVTAGSAVATDGTPLAAGEGLFIPTKDVSRVYAIASAAAQDLYWFSG